jgi:hypothetical protein
MRGTEGACVIVRTVAQCADRWELFVWFSDILAATRCWYWPTNIIPWIVPSLTHLPRLTYSVLFTEGNTWNVELRWMIAAWTFLRVCYWLLLFSTEWYISSTDGILLQLISKCPSSSVPTSRFYIDLRIFIFNSKNYRFSFGKRNVSTHSLWWHLLAEYFSKQWLSCSEIPRFL